MTEWPNVLDSKSSEPLRVPRVQIPLSPPFNFSPGHEYTGKLIGDRPGFFYMISMKYLNFIVPFFLICFLVACTGTDSTTGSSTTSNTPENLTAGSSSKTTHENGWTIVSTMENDDRVYWFFAPDIDSVSPAMFKKTILNKDKSKQGFEVVSKCDAPKQVCDDLMKHFKTLSEKYQ